MAMFQLFAILYGISWFAAILVCLPIQLALFLTVKPISPWLFRKVNYHIFYSCWSPILALVEFSGNFKLTMYFKDQQSLDNFGKERIVAVTNHTYELDWLPVAAAMDKFGFLAGVRSFSKHMLKFFPFVGWQLYLMELCFLHRDWSKDCHLIANSMNTFAQFPHPMLVLLYCEGTRLTHEKYATSLEFAKSRGVDHFKHHLIPRAKGFTFIISQIIKDQTKRISAIYNVQVAFRDSLDKNASTFYGLFTGLPMVADVYFDRTAIESIEIDANEESLGKYLNDLYHRKDQLMDYHKTHHEFPGIKKVIQPRLAPLINFIFWFSSVHASFAYLIVSSIINGNIWTLISLVTVSAVLGLFFVLLLRNNRIDKGSTYGAEKSAKNHSN